MIFLKIPSTIVAKKSIAANIKLCFQEILDFFTRKPENFTKALAQSRIKKSPSKKNIAFTKYLK